MHVAVDEAGQHSRALSVDHAGARRHRLDLCGGADGGYLATRDSQRLSIGAIEIHAFAVQNDQIDHNITLIRHAAP